MRYFFTLLAVLSFALCVATCFLWIRSIEKVEAIIPPYNGFYSKLPALLNYDGRIIIIRSAMTHDPREPSVFHYSSGGEAITLGAIADMAMNEPTAIHEDILGFGYYCDAKSGIYVAICPIWAAVALFAVLPIGCLWQTWRRDRRVLRNNG